MINTAHRFSESLHFTDEFRRLWAIAENREVIIKNVEENIRVRRREPFWLHLILIFAIQNPPQVVKAPSPSPRIGHPSPPRRPPPTSGSLYDRCIYLAQLCKDGSIECVRTLAGYFITFAKILASAFTLSGKDGLPREDF